MRTNLKCCVVVVGLTLAATAVGCSGGQDSGSGTAADKVGTLRVALTTTTSARATYHLANAFFEISNPFIGFDTIVSGDDPTLTVELAPSIFDFDYQVILLDGWTLNQVDAGGTEHQVGATLLNNFIPFTIKSQRTTPVTFQFKAGTLVVTFGNGAASIKVDVDDTSIDDFEDGDGVLAPIGGRNGVWFSFNDGSGSQVPAPGDVVNPEVVSTDANFVLHETGKGFASQGFLPDGTFAFGAGVGTDLLMDPSTGQALPYDASGYDGIGFSFRYAFPSNQVPFQILSFFVATSATTPVERGGTCTTGCDDDFGIVGPIPFSPLFFSGSFAWSQLRQQGFGTPATFDPATILSLKWIIAFPDFGQPTSSNVFDFQLDNVAFVKAQPLTTASKAPPSAASVWSPAAAQ